MGVQIIGRKVIADAYRKHSEWRASLRSWTRIVEEAWWKNFADIRNTFRTADLVGRYVVFDIANNRARLIALIDYEDHQVIVTRVLRHDEYDREDFA